MATVRKRGLKWQVQVRRRGFDAASRSFAQQRDAERWGVMKEREFDLLESQGRSGSKACDVSVKDLLVRYRTTVVPKKRSASRESYMVAALERASFTSLRADKLNSRQIASYRDARLTVVTAATVVRELGLLQHAFELARKSWGYENLSNPVRDVEKPALPQGRTRRLRTGEELRLRSAADASRNPLLIPIMTLALETSMRLGEIVSARWEHFDPDARVLLLPITKNGKPRTIPLSRVAIAQIESQARTEDGPIFPTTVEAIKRAWIRLTRRANVADLRFHDLRHEAISRLVERGFDLPSVMMFSGHSDHRMLLRYTHLNARSLVTKLDSLDDDRKLLVTPLH
jgi:integrase